MKFQFHKGTIRTLRASRHASHLPQFQFHKGTIRTYKTTQPTTLTIISIP